jgi:hypothetical protein
MVPTTKSSGHETLADRYAATHGFGPALMPSGDKKTITPVSLVTVGEAKTRLYDETVISTYVPTAELLGFLRRQFVVLPYDALPELRDRWIAARTKTHETKNTPAPSRTFDDLSRIRGIGVLVARRLALMGITSYAQIASWSPEDACHIERQLIYRDRIGQENWVEQAQVLAAGGTTLFSRRVDKGEVPVNIPDYLPFERSDITD